MFKLFLHPLLSNTNEVRSRPRRIYPILFRPPAVRLLVLTNTPLLLGITESERDPLVQVRCDVH